MSERLSEEERDIIENAWIIAPHDGPRDGADDPMYRAVEAILAARLADQAARLAAVEALTERLGTDTHDCFKPWCPQCSVIKRERQIRDMLRALLHPQDPDQERTSDDRSD